LLVAVAAGPVLAGCAGGGTAQDPATAGLAAVFPPQVRARAQGSFGLDRWEPVTDAPPAAAGRGLRVRFPQGSVSPSATRDYGAPAGGMQAYLPRVDGPLDAAYLRYWVRFPADFAFARGGKLPGLWGGTQVSGGDEPDGDDGFSTRLMWRSGGDGEVYLYAPSRSGDSLGRGDWTWPTDRWVCVEQQVVLNEPGSENGSVTVWLDGNQVHRTADLDYRSVADLKIEGIFFSTFFGGNERSWASPRDQYADFAGFSLTPDRVGCAA